ncbi:MAG: heme biosynthesis protein HemY, partial [Rhodocyclaceae bacterium]|nr:heme biosynthesis protein HemY [Rhodocyclaceae bacterium]
LIELYAECRGADATGRLSRAEKWLRLHPQDDVLLLVLGRLCVEQQLWGKAKSFLEASLSIRETRNANSELARLHEQLGELVLAARRYRAAALLP